MRIGVIGASGFIGKHICLSIVQVGKYKLEQLSKADCIDNELLNKKVDKIDVLVIAGGVNRSGDENKLYDENIQLVQNAISASSASKSCKQLVFLSSIQNSKENAYGRAKRDSELLLKNFSIETGKMVNVIVLPNIFGESQKPNYNCVVPTFINQIIKGEQSDIADAEVELLHVRHVVSNILNLLGRNGDNFSVTRLEGVSIRVSELYKMISNFLSYVEEGMGIIPKLESTLKHDLFNTFRYMCWGLGFHVNNTFLVKKDERGCLIELVKSDTAGQVFFSTTKPGFVRGIHFHTRKIERFCLLSGHSSVSLVSVFGDFSIDVDCSSPEGSWVDIPNYTMHSVKNVGGVEVLGVFWVNETFDLNDSDTYTNLI